MGKVIANFGDQFTKEFEKFSELDEYCKENGWWYQDAYCIDVHDGFTVDCYEEEEDKSDE